MPQVRRAIRPPGGLDPPAPDCAVCRPQSRLASACPPHLEKMPRVRPVAGAHFGVRQQRLVTVLSQLERKVNFEPRPSL